MAEKIAIIGDAPLATGFALAGVPDSFVVEKGKEFEDTLQKVISDPQYGIVIVNQSFMHDIDWRLKKRIGNMAHPVVIGVPSFSGESDDGEGISALIKRALGFDVSKK
ncbi:MAG TPA: V-type ATP synthase subunit F [Candidatus Bilamarchaeaceae archaeon]|nr:V-type ATP synthase subunit F [Candidatus Bilamarchaeaceae archaeon]